MNNRQTTKITIEHVVVTSTKSYEQVTALLEERMGVAVELAEVLENLRTAKSSWEQVAREIEKRLGKSSFSIFSRIDHGVLLSLAGKPSKAIQYTIGNPLLAVQMTEQVLPVSLYAPFKLAVYEDDKARTIISYDRLSSLVAQYHNEKVIAIAHIVDKKLEDLVAEVI